MSTTGPSAVFIRFTGEQKEERGGERELKPSERMEIPGDSP